jgi:hypothetical protein
MRTCTQCGGELPNWIRIDGVRHNVRHRTVCVSCRPWGERRPVGFTKRYPRARPGSSAEAVNEWRRRTKLRAIEYKGGKCSTCGYDRCVAALAFHHLDPTQKEFRIGGATRSWERTRAELDKCVLLCANCHAEEHDRLQRASA